MNTRSQASVFAERLLDLAAGGTGELPVEPRAAARPLLIVLELVVLAGALYASYVIAGRPAVGPGLLLMGNLVIGGTLAGWLVSLVWHELSHLLAALVMGVPVRGIAIGSVRLGQTAFVEGFAGHVLMDLPAGAAIPGRMIAIHLAGPLADVGAAAVAYSFAAQASVPELLRFALVGVGAGCLLAGIVNLVPHSSTPGTVSDGASAFAWATRPSAQLEQVRLIQDLTDLVSALAPLSDQTAFDAEPAERSQLACEILVRLRTAAADLRVEVAMVGVMWLISARPALAATVIAAESPAERADAQIEMFLDDSAALMGALLRDDIPPRVRGEVAARACDQLAYLSLQRIHDSTDRPSVGEVALLARIAESGVRAEPDRLPVRTLLALARILQDRPVEARRLLDGAQDPEPGLERVHRARAYAVLGLAELALSDRAQAARLAKAADRVGQGGWMVGLLHERLRRFEDKPRIEIQ